MNFQQIEITGCSLVGAISKLGYAGPKHYGIVIGQSQENGKVYVAESRYTGYQLVTYDEFVARYSENGDIQIIPNSGKFSDREVAERSLGELANGGNGNYNFLFNNCESFSNRAMYDTSISTQVINTLAVTALLSAGVWLIKNAKS